MMLPFGVQNLIISAFTDEELGAYGQLATNGLNKFPQVRTVHFHWMAEKKALVFNCHTSSSKWAELKSNPYHSGCYVDLKRYAQFRWEGKAVLVDSTYEKEKTFLDKMWLLMREEVRLAYWLDQEGITFQDGKEYPFDLKKRAPNMGVVLCSPTFWNIYEMSPENYVKGQCTLYKKTASTWSSEKKSILGC
ncbi:MAG: pyridoxamine 5'-phosphate oxidase family protein [Deltaproteobacteria bacterium]|nr:pyridoxamine 5'-phosphate oxidase family protein [Deltaproteobacteria bacterium]